jgi:transposase
VIKENKPTKPKAAIVVVKKTTARIVEMEMITVEDRERIRRAYFIEQKSIRQIAREYKHGRAAVRQAIESAEPGQYRRQGSYPAPVLGPYKERIAELLAENEGLPRKQRYTGHKIYKIIWEEGYRGSEPGVRRLIGRLRRGQKRPALYLPLEFDPGQDAQVDWGEGMVIVDGQSVKAQLFYMRLCYSRRLFMMAFPAQKQEAFLEGHVQAFHHFGGIPHRISYDNLKVAVKRVLEGRNREEQQSFIVFRSHYLFKSHFCTPGQGHEKGGVEHSVGFGRRNFLVPIPEVASFAELNESLLAQCLADDQRQVTGQAQTIGAAWEVERGHLRCLPGHDLACCQTVPVTLTPYSQVVFETNRYSVPVEAAARHLTLKAYPFAVDILHQAQVIASHSRCYQRHQDILDPLHYLPLLAQRPGAFDYAKPLRRWRAIWPAVYEELLTQLRAQWPEGRGVREFIQVLQLHRHHPAELVEQAVKQALAFGCPHYDGVKLCLNQLLRPTDSMPSLSETAFASHQGYLAQIGSQPLNLAGYEQLLSGG